MNRGASDTPSLSPELQGASHERIALFAGLRRQSVGLGVSRHGQPVDPAFPLDRFVARHAGLKVDPDHHAAACGSCLPVHGAFVAQGEASVTETRQENVS